MITDISNIDDLLHEESFWLDTRDAFLRKFSITMIDAVDIEMQCITLRDSVITEISDPSFEWSTPRKVYLNKIGSTKKRIVYLFPLEERIVIGVLYRLLSHYFSNHISDSCFSYKKGVNTIQAVNHLLDGNKNCSMYGVKLDISAYFNSVSPERLNEMIETTFANDKGSVVYNLVKKLYSIKQVSDKEVVKDEYMSLIPGTAIASFFANLCLHDLDVYFESRGIPYARYSDDIILFGDTKEEIEESLVFINAKLKEYGLSINPKKYEYFNPHDSIDFLGLTFNDKVVDIHKNSFNKMKEKIRRSCRKARKDLENGKSYEKVMSSVIHKFNHRVFKCYVEDRSKYGWAYYAFRYINTDKTIKEIDFYFRDRLRWIKTGRNNKANIIKTPDEVLTSFGYVSLTQMYHLFKIDFDAYCDEVSLLK